MIDGGIQVWDIAGGVILYQSEVLSGMYMYVVTCTCM